MNGRIKTVLWVIFLLALSVNLFAQDEDYESGASYNYDTEAPEFDSSSGERFDEGVEKDSGAYSDKDIVSEDAQSYKDQAEFESADFREENEVNKRDLEKFPSHSVRSNIGVDYKDQHESKLNNESDLKSNSLVKNNNEESGGEEALDVSSLDKSTEVIVYDLLAPFRSLDEAQLVDLIHNKMAGNFVGKYLLDYPRVLLFITKSLRDEKALPRVASLIDDTGQVYLFVFLNILGFVIKIFLRNRDKKFDGTPGGLKRWLKRTTFVLGYFIIAYVWMFQDEFGPIFKIAKSVFF